MLKKIVVVILLIIAGIIIYIKYLNNQKTYELNISEKEEILSNSNILENVEYISKDAKGNQYIIRAKKGEIDFDNSDIIFLENVRSTIILSNSDVIKIKSDFGKYNTINYDTIFSRNVTIDYLDNNITGEYLDFSLVKNRMIISRNIVFTNLENILKGDVVEINIETKDTKIFMYEKEKKVNIKNKKY